MTYIAAFKHPRVSFIISDMRSIMYKGDQKFGCNSYLKTGSFFNGCIFGLSGNVERGREFILTVKAILAETMTPAESWSTFNQILSWYNFHDGKDDHFQIILSTRASGTPELFKLDSIKGLISYKFKSGWISVGSGKIFLDKFISEQCIPEINKWPNEIIENYPFFLCLKLTELSESFGHGHLEKIDVGGLFHFIYQTENLEASQKPALFVLSAANLAEKTIYLWIYRICRVYDDRGLFVDKWTPSKSENKRFVSFDPITWPEMPNSVDDSFVNQIIEEVEAQPFYYFCGFGFTNPTQSKKPAVHFTTKGDYLIRKPINSKDLRIDPRAQKILAENYETVIENRGKKI